MSIISALADSLKYCLFVTSSAICKPICMAFLPMADATRLNIGNTDRNKDLNMIHLPQSRCIRAL